MAIQAHRLQVLKQKEESIIKRKGKKRNPLLSDSSRRLLGFPKVQDGLVNENETKLSKHNFGLENSVLLFKTEDSQELSANLLKFIAGVSMSTVPEILRTPELLVGVSI